MGKQVSGVGGQVSEKPPTMAAVRAAARELEMECVRQGKEFFTMTDLADKLDLKDYKAKARAQGGQVRVLIKGGEMVRLSPGRYRYMGKPAKPPTTEERMWFILRKRGTVTAAYLAQMCDTPQHYALQFLNRLRPEFVRKVEKAGREPEFSLINDPGSEMPKNEAKAEYLREHRAEMKRKVIAHLDAVYGQAVDLMQEAAAARLAVTELEEDGHDAQS